MSLKIGDAVRVKKVQGRGGIRVGMTGVVEALYAEGALLQPEQAGCVYVKFVTPACTLWCLFANAGYLQKV